MSDIKDRAHHSIMIMTGARNKICCPECGSDEFYRNSVFDRCDTEYDDGHTEVGYLDYAHADYRCNDCDYCDED